MTSPSLEPVADTVRSMLAVTVSEPGGPEQLVLDEVPDPPVGDGEVLIDVTGAGVNRADLLQRQGLYPPPPGATDVLGLECSGVVLAAPPGMFAVGDAVCALLTGGGYAQRVAVPAGQVMPVPDGVDLVAAAGLPEVACTVFSNLAITAGLQPAEWLLVHGGGSGIGTFAIQWARAIGARVAVTAGSAAKLDRCRKLGAEVLVNYRESDFVEVVHEATSGHGADVILDVIGAKYLARNLETLAVGGRLVVIGLQGGVKGELDLARLLRQRATVTATSLRARPSAEKAAICAAVVRDVWPLVESGAIRPVIDRILPLGEAAQAHRALEAGETVGKIVLEVE